MFVIIFIFLIFISPLNAQESNNFSIPEEIIVKSTRSETNIYQLGGSVDIITSEQIKKSGFNFVNEALQTIPGLYISQNGALGGTATARIRGAASGQTLVLIDGVSVSDPSTPGGEFDFSSLLSSNIERIEILKGSQSTLWGSDAIGGVINIITTNEAIGPSIKLNTEIGSFNTQKIGADLRYSNTVHNLYLSYNQFKSDGISKADKSDGNSEKDGIGSKSYLIKTDHKISGFEISTNLNYRESDIDYDSYGFVTGVTDGDENTKGRQINWALEAKKSFLDDRLTNTFSFSESEIDRKYYTNGIENFSAKGKRSFVRYIVNYNFNENNFFTFGAEAEESSTFDDDFETESLFFLYEVMPHEDLGLSFGLREDKRDNLPSEETPKVTVYYNINDNLRLSSNWGEGFKLPTIFQSTFFCCGADKPNNNLAPETSEGYEVGLTYESNERDNLVKKLIELEGSLKKDIRLMNNDEHPFYDTSISNKSMFRNSISLLNINSIKDFESKINQKIEKSIFRGNLYFDGIEAWEERNWIGKTIKINDVLFKVEKNIPRCVAINLKPKTDDNSFNLLKTLKQTYDHYDMGVYLTPENDGEINLSEKILIK